MHNNMHITNRSSLVIEQKLYERTLSWLSLIIPKREEEGHITNDDIQIVASEKTSRKHKIYLEMDYRQRYLEI